MTQKSDDSTVQYALIPSPLVTLAAAPKFPETDKGLSPRPTRSLLPVLANLF
jgi:hypothetical protein